MCLGETYSQRHNQQLPRECLSAAAPLPLLLAVSAATCAAAAAAAARPLRSQARRDCPRLLNRLLCSRGLHSSRLLLLHRDRGCHKHGRGWLRCHGTCALRRQACRNRPRLLDRLLRCRRLHSSRLLQGCWAEAAAAAPKPWLLSGEVQRLLGDGNRRWGHRRCRPEVLGKHDLGLCPNVACTAQAEIQERAFKRDQPCRPKNQAAHCSAAAKP